MRNDIDSELASFLERASAGLALKGVSPLLYNAVKDFVLRKGKRIRPALFIISYLGHIKNTGGAYRKAVKASVSLELVHDFLLVHDDVIDNSGMRRGRPTIHRVFNAGLGLPDSSGIGSSLAITAGDLIFALAVEAFAPFAASSSAKEESLKAFSRAASYTGIGEFIEVAGGIKDMNDVTVKDIMDIYTLKTAKYTFETPLVLGAVSTGIKGAEIKKLSALGIMLGQAFQIQDDLLDLYLPSEDTGKFAFSDIKESKRTLLAVKTYKSLGAKDRVKLKNIMKKDGKTRSDIMLFKQLVSESDAGIYCLKKTGALFKKALTVCSGLNMRARYKAMLKEFIRGLRIEIRPRTPVRGIRMQDEKGEYRTR